MKIAENTNTALHFYVKTKECVMQSGEAIG
jgi:hypothetical protein